LSGGVESGHAGHTRDAGLTLKKADRMREREQSQLGRHPSGSSAPPAQTLSWLTSEQLANLNEREEDNAKIEAAQVEYEEAE
jgi:hypothetical protein